MGNRTYVCFGCRTTDRVPAHRISRNCRKCRQRAEHVYYKFEIPQADDDFAWQDLQTKVRAFNRHAKARVLERLRQERTRLVRLLEEVPATKLDRGRSLRSKLKAVDEKIKPWNLW